MFFRPKAFVMGPALLALGAGCRTPLPDPVELAEPTPPDLGDVAFDRDRFVTSEGDDAADGSEPSPWRTVEHAVAALRPGDRLVLGEGSWPGFEIPVSGEDGSWIGVVGPDARVTGSVQLVSGVHHVQIEGLDIGDFSGDDVAGVRLQGAGHHVIVRDNRIHDVTGESAMGINLYGHDGDGIHDVWIVGNRLQDLEPARSEALVVNGNVQRFRIEANHIEDVNNIGIDVIGGERSISEESPSDGAVVGNRVIRANSSYEDGAAAGIYVDGADRILIEGNRVEACDFGIEIGAENHGFASQGVVVRSNVTWRNYKGGLIFGGFSRTRGRVADLWVGHNTFVMDGRPDEDSPQGKRGAANGAVIVQFADRATLVGNLFVVPDGTEAAVAHWGAGDDVVFSENLYWGGPAEPEDAEALGFDPGFVDLDAGDLRLREDSGALDRRASEVLVGALDQAGNPRLAGPALDLGAYERPL